MVSEAPPFWWSKADWRAWALWPFSHLYGRIAGRRMRRARRASVSLPVICVGNFTVGGAGKTPTAIAIARAAKENGLKPGFLSRGYGGTLDVTTVVDPAHHRAEAVGDEALLLAREGLTVISRKRVDGAKKLAEQGADLIIMDDGFQSARLTLDFALVVIDTLRGIGNGHLVPGGPVRAPIREQMHQLNAILKVGSGEAADALVRQAARAGKQVYVASLKPKENPKVSGQSLFAFAGIADPEKFYRTLREIGGFIMRTRAFPDHHYFTADEVSDLLDDAAKEDLVLVTTAKDAVRLAGHHGRMPELAANAQVVEVEMVFDDRNAPAKIIDAAFANYRARRIREARNPVV